MQRPHHLAESLLIPALSAHLHSEKHYFSLSYMFWTLRMWTFTDKEQQRLMIKLKPISWWFSWISTFPFLSAVYCSNWETVREHSQAVQMDLCYQKREYYLLPDVTLLSPLCVLAPALIWPHNKIIQSANPRGKKKSQTEQKEKKPAGLVVLINFSHTQTSIRATA